MISRLKSLELQGYKTFASRTSFEFPGAVTAIVGPNGSGKSNITDALRWVLGEQSYSLLRGKKTEDMIFSGSDRRTRSGMATATVILDNSDSWLPIDYSEVSIARRAYRDGSNEYLLNGQRVRLRDVSELLSESGLAERTYTIIGQGLVDAALALRAEDRRRLFEEAAGIGLHRTRRQEAVRRLADTQRNLERVEDILQELRPRLRSLERQAKRAVDYEQAVSELKELLREWYGFHWHKAQEELAEAQKFAKEQAASLEDIRQRESQLDAEINLLRENRQKTRHELSIFHHQSTELHSRREKASRELAVAEERERNIEEQEGRSCADLAASSEEIAFLQERNKFAQEEVDRLQSELDEAGEQSAAAQNELEDRKQQRVTIETLLAENRKILVQKSTQRLEIVSRNIERQAQIESLKRSATHAEQSITERNIKRENLAEDVEKITNEFTAAELSLKEIEKSKSAIERTIQDQEFAKEELNDQLSSIETQISKFSTQLEVLKQAEQAFVGYSSGAKILQDAAKNDRLSRSKGILGSSIRVPEEFEVAIGAVLGEFIDSIVLDSEADISQALSIIEQNPEKSAILPLDVITGNENSMQEIEDEGIIGLASENVSAPSELMPAINLLLGNVLIVENREVARKVISDFRDGKQQEGRLQSMRAVTLVGEVFYLQGPVKTSTGSKPASLSRQREMREIIQNLEQANERKGSVVERASEIDRTLSKLNEEQSNIENLLEKQGDAFENTNNAHRQLLLEDEQSKREMDWQIEQLTQLTQAIEESEQQIQLSLEEVSSLEQSEKEFGDDIERLSQELKNFPIDEMQERVTHWKTRIAVVEQALAESKVRLVEREKSSADALRKSELVNSNIQTLGVSHSQTINEINNLQEEIKEVAKLVEANRKQTSPLEENLENIEQKLTKMLSLESKERQVSSRAEQNFTQARIAQVRKQEALDALRRQIEADFGLVAFEYREGVSGPTPLPLEGFVENLPILEELSEETEKALNRQRSLLRRLGPVNQEAQIEFKEVDERYQFMTSQVEDLERAAEDVQRVIEELDEIMEREFCNTFEAVAEEFHQIFGRLFGGGSARLVLTDPDDLTDTGIDIEARLPGRREQGLSLLSGGERSLTAVALVFALLRVSPTPFCVLDEVDAMLDEANVGRFRELLRELSQTTQFILITHNRATVQVADVIYGITMGRDSTSQILSLKVDELEKVV
jgi:chromosome segregation protein